MNAPTTFVGYATCPDCGASYASTHYGDCQHAGLDPRDIRSPLSTSPRPLVVEPTLTMRGLADGGKLYLTVEIRLPDGQRPWSHFRGTSVGVGGRSLRDRLGLGDIPVRAATRNEMRRLMRMNVADMLAAHPDGEIVVHRSRL